jgi:SAM-dependent methyltransferase
LLDLGCGTYPLFLTNVEFRENLRIIDFDIENGHDFPFDAASFDVVTMLAVFEHIEPSKLVDIVKNIYRVLKPGGHFVMTTPAFWTDGLLRVMARAGLVSREEIEEHRDVYSPRKIMDILRNGNFRTGVVRYGYFEMFANIWVAASK